MSNPPLPEGTKSIPWSVPAKPAPLLTKAEYFPPPPHPPEDVLLPVELPAAAPLTSPRSSGVQRLLSDVAPAEQTTVLVARQGLDVAFSGWPVSGSLVLAASLFQLLFF